MSEVAEGIVTEIRHRSENVLTVFDLMSCATSLFFLFIILKAMQYRYRFLTSERFDNIYITKNFRNIDMRRAKLGKETVLPLNKREKALYVPTGSLRLVKPEKKSISRAAVILTIATVKLCTHMLTDYALYWVLTVIRYHARFQSKVKAPNLPGVHIQGNGFLADLLKSIVSAFQPMGVELEIDTVPCLPDPVPPDYDRYIQIVSLLILCWILTILEPYGLRLRHSVMSYYHPTRAKQRSIWLYNQILRSRSSFLKFARRQLRRKITGAKDIAKVTCKEYLRAHIKSRLLLMCLPSDKQDACLLCGDVFREDGKSKPIRCQTPGCPGIYCEECFADLQNLCTVCLDPIEYGDMSDISEERDSSEAESTPRTVKKIKRKRKRLCRCSTCCCGDDSESDKQELLETETVCSEDFEEHKDYSDYSSSEATDYSYTYQDEKDLSVAPETTPRTSFTDPEAQRLPDYASMDSFHDIDTTALDYDLSTSSDESYDAGQMSGASLNKSRTLTRKKSKEDRLRDFLKMRVISRASSDSSDDEEDLLLPRETTFSASHHNIHSISTESYSSSTSRSVSKCCKITFVPPLHLSPLESSSNVSSVQNTFRNVRYEVVREISSSTSSYECRGGYLRSNTSSLSFRRSVPRSKYVHHSDFQPDEKYKGQKKRVMEYYKSTSKMKPNAGNRPATKMHSGLLKFITKFFHKTPTKTLPSTYEGKSPSEHIDKVSLLSPKSSANSCDLSSNNSSSSSPEKPSCVYTSTTSHSTLMGSTPRKHLRAGEETVTFEDDLSTKKAIPPDLDSSDSDITLIEAQSNTIKAHQSENYQMTTDNKDTTSPSTKIYSREPPERDESHTTMRNQHYHDAHSKSDSSVLSKTQKNRPEDYFNTSLIDTAVLPSRSAEYEQKPKHCEFAVDDEGTCSDSTCPHYRKCNLKECHHITHYRSRCSNKKKYSNRCNCPKCYHCRDCPYTTDEEPTTSYSNTSIATDFMDLPYQHNNEYLGLVNELEDTLSARNKERVRKTMREFEYLSRQNKNLEKPIFDDDDDEQEERGRAFHHQCRQQPRRRALPPRSASVGKNSKCYCQRKECICHFSQRALENCERRLATVPASEGFTRTGSAVNSMPSKPAVAGDAASRCRTRWRMNPRTGEWYKMYDEDTKYYKGSLSPTRHGNSPRTDYHRDPSGYSHRHNPPGRCCSPDCYCCRHGGKY